MKQFTSNKEMIDYLFALRQMSVKLSLDNINRLMVVLDQPQFNYPVIHVAGTNGKGSTCAIMAEIYQTAGYKTGLYTSPHLISLGERIQVNGEMISLETVRNYFNSILATVEKYHCSFFEVITAIAFAYFRDQRVDIAVVEAGLGGRLDATNVVQPEVCVITEIDIDHTKQLGNTPVEIAREKAGIIKTGVPVLSSTSKPEVINLFAGICAEKKSSFIPVFQNTEIVNNNCTLAGCKFSLRTSKNNWNSLYLSLLGKYQILNAVTAIRTIELLDQAGFTVSAESVATGLQHVNWPGRLQVLQKNPFLIVDCAHNPHGIQHTIQEITTLFSYHNIICIFGVLRDKNYKSIIKILNPFVQRYITVTPKSPRALAAKELAAAIKKTGKKADFSQSILDGLQSARDLAKQNDLICVLGSHFIVGDIIDTIKNS